MRKLVRPFVAFMWLSAMVGIAWVMPFPKKCHEYWDCYVPGGFLRGAAPIFGHSFTWAQGIILLAGILGFVAVLLAGGWPGRISRRRRLIRIVSLWCLISGVSIAAAIDLRTDDTAPERLAPVFAGFSLALAINVLGSPRGRSLMSVRVTKGIRFALAFFSAVGWLVGMLAVGGWILPSGGFCSSLESGAVDPCPHVTFARTAQNLVMLAGVIGFFLILAVALYVRSRDGKAEWKALRAPAVPIEPSRTGA